MRRTGSPAARLTFTTGANAAIPFEIKAHLRTSGIDILELWMPTPFPSRPATPATVTAGCRKTFATCKSKFDNVANFRGFPHIPGTDVVTRYGVAGRARRRPAARSSGDMLMPSRDRRSSRAARRYIGTPYHHQAALAGAGCDCLGLIRGVWRDLYGSEPEAPPPYRPDWGETGAVEHMLEAAARHMRPGRRSTDADAGDVRDLPPAARRDRQACRHPDAPGRMIHAQSNDQVREVTMNGWWHRRAVAAFGWPDR